MYKAVLSVSALLGCFGVVLGAFGAHYLKQKLSLESLAVFETGVRYQMYHAFALFISAWALGQFEQSFFGYSAYAFILGVLLFSGSLYLISVYGLRGLGIVTPIGGLFLIVGWVFLLVGFLKS